MLSAGRYHRTGSPMIDAPHPAGTAVQRMPRSAALALYERELAYYRADATYLTVEKAAERCLKLSFLLTQAQIEGS